MDNMSDEEGIDLLRLEPSTLEEACLRAWERSFQPFLHAENLGLIQDL